MNTFAATSMREEELVPVRSWVRLLREYLKEYGINLWLHMDKRLWVLTLRAGTGSKPTYQLKVYAPAVALWDTTRRIEEVDRYVTEFKSIFRKD